MEADWKQNGRRLEVDWKKNESKLEGNWYKSGCAGPFKLLAS